MFIYQSLLYLAEGTDHFTLASGVLDELDDIEADERQEDSQPRLRRSDWAWPFPNSHSDSPPLSAGFDAHAH